jgi:hypothetical protein
LLFDAIDVDPADRFPGYGGFEGAEVGTPIVWITKSGRGPTIGY